MDYGILQSHLDYVSRETYSQLQSYVELLHHWNQRINLIGECPIEEIWFRHVIDSAQLYPLIPDRKASLIDMGSGAGLPGIILAILGCSNITLIESDMKKCQFLHEAARITKTHVRILPERIEKAENIHAHIITARALASLNDLLPMAMKLSHEDTYCLFPKGSNWSKEIDTVREHWKFQMEHFPSVTSPDSVILKLSELKAIY